MSNRLANFIQAVLFLLLLPLAITDAVISAFTPKDEAK